MPTSRPIAHLPAPPYPRSGITWSDVPPPASLATWVASCWTLHVAADCPVEWYTAIPDGCVHLVIHPGGATLRGPQPTAARRTVQPGSVTFGIRFHPGAARAILPMPDGAPLRCLERRASTVAGLATLVAQSRGIDTTRPTAELAGALAATLEPCLAGARAPDRPVAEAVRTLHGEHPAPTVEALSNRVGLSTRQFRRRFMSAVGLSPREYVRIVRFRRCVLALLDGDDAAWAARAASHGFADQSHLIREFRRLGGWAPETFVTRLRNVAHRGAWNPANAPASG